MFSDVITRQHVTQVLSAHFVHHGRRCEGQAVSDVIVQLHVLILGAECAACQQPVASQQMVCLMNKRSSRSRSEKRKRRRKRKTNNKKK